MQLWYDLHNCVKEKNAIVRKQVVMPQSPANSLNKPLSNFQPEEALYNKNYLKVVGLALFVVILSCTNNYIVLRYL